MAVKDKTKTVKKKTVRKVKVKSDRFVNEIFSFNELADDFILKIVNSTTNIFLISSPDCDKSIISAYLKNHIAKKTSSTVMENIDVDISSFLSRYKRLIFPELSIKEVVHIFEYILSGFDGFAVGINLNSYDNLIEKLQTLISIQYPSLSLSQINCLIYEAHPIFIYFSKDEDGLFVVQSIDEVLKVGTSLILNNKFSNKQHEIKEVKQLLDVKQEQVLELKQEGNSVEEIFEKRVEIPVEEVLKVDTSLIETKKELKKPNKYKLLKEKIKNKKRIAF
ncbi:hypothetical protein IJD44_09530 [bacterium]|nr:hypothetical protein [bacterium]